MYIDAVNAKGGVNGEQIKLTSLDDEFKPAKGAENAKKLIDDGVVTLFLTRGTPHTQAILPLLSEYHVPLIAPSTGAMIFNSPTNPWVFNVRSSYQHEAERAVAHLVLTGVTRLAILETDDSFGSDAVQGVQKGLAAAHLAPVSQMTFDHFKPNFQALMPEILKHDPQAVFFIGSSRSVADGVAQLRATGSFAQAVTLSNNASAGFIKELGTNAHGVIVSQVFPYERGHDLPLIREAQDLARKNGIAELTPQMVEGFAAAKVLVEALRRAGPKPTRASVLKVLDDMHSYDIGGLVIKYAANNHSGVEFADLAIIDTTGRFMR